MRNASLILLLQLREVLALELQLDGLDDNEVCAIILSDHALIQYESSSSSPRQFRLFFESLQKIFFNSLQQIRMVQRLTLFLQESVCINHVSLVAPSEDCRNKDRYTTADEEQEGITHL